MGTSFSRECSGIVPRCEQSQYNSGQQQQQAHPPDLAVSLLATAAVLSALSADDSRSTAAGFIHLLAGTGTYVRRGSLVPALGRRILVGKDRAASLSLPPELTTRGGK